jgi:hypothetical protein
LVFVMDVGHGATTGPANQPNGKEKYKAVKQDVYTPDLRSLRLSRRYRP